MTLGVGAFACFVIWQTYQSFLHKKAETPPPPALHHDDDANALHEIPLAAVSSGMRAANTLLVKLRKDPKDTRALNKVANLSLRHKLFGRAADFYRQYLALEPEDWKARVKYAAALGLAGNNEKAIAEYRRIIEKNPNQPEPHADLARLYVKLNRKQDARAVLAAALTTIKSDEARKELESLSMSLETISPPPTEGKGSDATVSQAQKPATNLSDFDKVVNLVWTNAAI
ncbi:MAG: tetratricopeptide repeat protein [Deltaproteobacteria bacterium]|nr:tetratricopeptide repeat protein [Deltaproteobacteria bacterium]